MCAAAGIGIVVLISADRIWGSIFVSAVVNGDGPSLSQFDAGSTLRVGIERAICPASAHHLEATEPGVRQIERKTDPVCEMIGILGADAFVDDADNIAVPRFLRRTQDLRIWQRQPQQAGTCAVRHDTGSRSQGIRRRER